ncbi:MATE family efflux transporter [Luteimonas arsenica]|uniref:MATE family efflux transporter n=1 Tax=Luteimonas arsenica TaxID=1586242 RepID=UPI001054824F|nr:MATE family efflux transporter [Luteimonas arsenica]
MVAAERSTEPLTRAAVARQAWPIILANAAVPALGLVDTAVIGHYGSATELGALALGALLFNFVYWSFGFLRMGTTGFVAQARGAGDEAEVRATLARALLLAAGLGGGLWLLQWPITWLYFGLMDGSAAVESVAGEYFRARIWGAPAALALFVISGLLIGLGRSRELLFVQLLLNGLNAGLDIWFAGALGLGARGIGLGTAIAEWGTCAVALVVVLRVLRARHRDAWPFLQWSRIANARRIRQALAANGDILVRTLCLLFAFAWFANAGARFGDVTLAANHILLQLVSFSAFFLDGFAFVAEARVGAAWGARDRAAFRHAVRLTSELAAGAALALAAAVLVLGEVAVAALTSLLAVRETAAMHLPWAALYVLLSVAAFQLDGVFIGTTRTREMRQAGLLSLTAFLLLAWPAVAVWGNHGLWAAFVAYVCVRAAALWPHYRRMDASLPAST